MQGGVHQCGLAGLVAGVDVGGGRQQQRGQRIVRALACGMNERGTEPGVGGVGADAAQDQGLDLAGVIAADRIEEVAVGVGAGRTRRPRQQRRQREARAEAAA